MNSMITLDEIKRIPLPQKTDSYTPISHIDLITKLRDGIHAHNYDITEEEFSASTNGAILNGHFKLSLNKDPEMTFEIGLLNSYNKQKRATIASGGLVRVCQNGCVLGDSHLGAIKRKHSGNADIEVFQYMNEMLDNADKEFDRIILMKDKLKLIPLTKNEMAELAGRWFINDNVVTATQLGVIKREMDKPSYKYGTDGQTMWDLYNDATLSYKESTPYNWFDNHIRLSKWTINEFGLNIPATEEEYELIED